MTKTTSLARMKMEEDLQERYTGLFLGGAKTWTATIWIGRKNRATKQLIDADSIKQAIADYCQEQPFCVSITPTEFIYTNGGEPGFAIGLIQYPRFQTTEDELYRRALEIAALVQRTAEQLTCSVVMQDQTILLQYNPGDAPWEKRAS